MLPGKLSFQKTFSYFRERLKGLTFKWKKSFHQVPPGNHCPWTPTTLASSECLPVEHPKARAAASWVSQFHPGVGPVQLPGRPQRKQHSAPKVATQTPSPGKEPQFPRGHLTRPPPTTVWSERRRRCLDTILSRRNRRSVRLCRSLARRPRQVSWSL